LLPPHLHLGVVRPCAERRCLGLLALGLFAIQFGLRSIAAPLGQVTPLVPDLPFAEFDELIYRSPIFRSWESLLGAVLGAALVYARRGARGPLATLFAVGWARNAVLAVAIVGLLLVTGGPRLLGWKATPHLEEWTWFGLATPFWLLLIAALACGPTLVTPWLERGWLVLLGEASYALYILHWIPLTLLIWAMAGARPPALLGLAVLGATLLAALASYRWIETPSRAWLRSWARGRGRDRETARRTEQASTGAADSAPAPTDVALTPIWRRRGSGDRPAVTVSVPLGEAGRARAEAPASLALTNGVADGLAHRQDEESDERHRQDDHQPHLDRDDHRHASLPPPTIDRPTS
jgi:hypothetical protein